MGRIPGPFLFLLYIKETVHEISDNHASTDVNFCGWKWFLKFLFFPSFYPLSLGYFRTLASARRQRLKKTTGWVISITNYTSDLWPFRAVCKACMFIFRTTPSFKERTFASSALTAEGTSERNLSDTLLSDIGFSPLVLPPAMNVVYAPDYVPLVYYFRF